MMAPAKLKILIVDDAVDFVQMMRARLRSSGYQVIAAYDGEEGFAKAGSERPDLILMDLMLPGINGYEICRLLKEDERTLKIPVIMLTAMPLDRYQKATGRLRAEAFLQKPFEDRILLETIQTILLRRAA